VNKQVGMISTSAIIALVIIAALIIYGISGYNDLASQNQSVNSSWAQIQNQYQRRMDLIPNLVNTVKGEANFEKSTLSDVINARSKASQINMSPELLNNPEQFQKFQQTQGALGSSLSRLMVVVEKYPDLKTNAQFAQLMDEVSGTENRIAVARRDFNNTVQQYNTAIALFPKNIFAGIFGFKHKEYFQADAGAAKAPAINFSS
jgi:LemA protein